MNLTVLTTVSAFSVGGAIGLLILLLVVGIMLPGPFLQNLMKQEEEKKKNESE